MTRLVIVGYGTVTTRLIEALVMYKNGGISVIVIGEEPQLVYNRIQLSPVLGGERPSAQALFHPAQWYLNRGVTVPSDEAVLAADVTSRSLIITKRLLFWNELVFSTGSYPFTPPIPGVQQPHVYAFRTMQGAEAILQQSGPKVVLGGGALGVEAAAALRLHGDDVMLIHHARRLMEQQLDQQASDLLQVQPIGCDTRCELSSGLVSIEADCVTLLDGQRIAVDGVVIATGAKPNISLAQECGAACQQGTVMDEQLRTSMSGISAVGRRYEINGQTWGLVAPRLKQAEVLAARLAGFIGAGFDWQASRTCLKVTGVDLFSVGVMDMTVTGATPSIYDPFNGHYRRLLARDGKLHGVLLMGDCRSAAPLTDLLAQGAIAHSDWLFDRFNT